VTIEGEWGQAEGSTNNGTNAGQSNAGNGGSSGNLEPPNNSNNGGGGETVTSTGGTLQAGYLPNGTRYSISFYDILTSI